MTRESEETRQKYMIIVIHQEKQAGRNISLRDV